MRVHQNQVNPNVQMDAMYAAQKAAAKREAERTRRKLTEFASELAGEAESEACVVRLESHEDGGESRPDRFRPPKRAKNKEDDADGTESTVSDWA